MHEMSLAEGVREVVEAAARRADCQRVSTVWLEIGALASVEVEALRFCFDAVMRGGLAEGARLEIIEVAGRGVCLNCHSEIAVSELYAACPVCSGYGVRLTAGDELRVREIEVQ